MAEDLFDEQEPEEFELEQESEKLDKSIYKHLKEQKAFDKLYNEKRLQLEKKRHRAKFTRVDNENHDICDNCGSTFKEGEDGSIVYGKDKTSNSKDYGEYAYCNDCMKQLYPEYKKVVLAASAKRSDFLSNHADVSYSKGFK